ncbi:hypothetical protein GC722_07170 [Auraticoccus sp. F435]|uniref:Pilus assembly protein TadE n=2 Tax=Auraticoccus cholistanensis TaxID=2656650 RepID=A0A6A9UW08_9ACTN|nr:hypothetical protein [Auraticoccus cholistanensis]
MVLVVLPSLFLLAGLVVDGGQQVAATRRAEAVAAATARVGADAGAAALVAGDATSAAAEARRAATSYLERSPQVRGTVSLDTGTVRVRTTSSETTVFLSLIGITSLTGEGSAEARVVPVGAG